MKRPITITQVQRASRGGGALTRGSNKGLALARRDARPGSSPGRSLSSSHPSHPISRHADGKDRPPGARRTGERNQDRCRRERFMRMRHDEPLQFSVDRRPTWPIDKTGGKGGDSAGAHPVHYATTLSRLPRRRISPRSRSGVRQSISSSAQKANASLSLFLAVSLALFFPPGNAVSPSVCRRAHTSLP